VSDRPEPGASGEWNQTLEYFRRGARYAPGVLDLQDPRERAFSALQPLAPTINRVLGGVNVRVADDETRNASARAQWTLTQRKTTSGYGRFCWTIDGLKTGLLPFADVSYVSNPGQEASNLFLWQIGWLTLRVKSEPSELAAEATEPMFARNSTIADETVCLSWEVSQRQAIRDARFVSVHDRFPWSITLAELLAPGADGDSDGSGGVTPLRPRPGGPLVSSNRPGRAADADDALAE
jgi:hypothetical protein